MSSSWRNGAMLFRWLPEIGNFSRHRDVLGWMCSVAGETRLNPLQVVPRNFLPRPRDGEAEPAANLGKISLSPPSSLNSLSLPTPRHTRNTPHPGDSPRCTTPSL